MLRATSGAAARRARSTGSPPTVPTSPSSPRPAASRSGSPSIVRAGFTPAIWPTRRCSGWSRRRGDSTDSPAASRRRCGFQTSRSWMPGATAFTSPTATLSACPAPASGASNWRPAPAVSGTTRRWILPTAWRSRPTAPALRRRDVRPPSLPHPDRGRRLSRRGRGLRRGDRATAGRARLRRRGQPLRQLLRALAPLPRRPRRPDRAADRRPGGPHPLPPDQLRVSRHGPLHRQPRTLARDADRGRDRRSAVALSASSKRPLDRGDRPSAVS